MTLPNVVIRNDPSTGKKIPAIVYNGKQYNNVEVFFKDGRLFNLRIIGFLGIEGVPPDYDVVELVSAPDTEFLEFRFYLKYGTGTRAGVEQAISSFSIRMSEIDRIDYRGEDLGNDYTL